MSKRTLVLIALLAGLLSIVVWVWVTVGTLTETSTGRVVEKKEAPPALPQNVVFTRSAESEQTPLLSDVSAKEDDETSTAAGTPPPPPVD